MTVVDWIEKEMDEEEMDWRKNDASQPAMMNSHLLRDIYIERDSLSSKEIVKQLNDLASTLHGQTGTMHPIDTEVEYLVNYILFIWHIIAFFSLYRCFGSCLVQFVTKSWIMILFLQYVKWSIALIFMITSVTAASKLLFWFYT